MKKKEIVIDGSKFNDVEGFYLEIDKKFTKELTWKTGHNFDALNDLLHGGFGIHEYGEPIIITWENAEKSKKDLGYDATIKHYEEMLIRCHPTNIDKINSLLEFAKRKNGNTLFELIIQIIQSHDNIDLILK
ncbi:barstar family protein [Pelosinus sp. IPA-1]|uniref:barstar family protein n=1 Tax=Pelosinus sp. IPA-1 TaxID=3029569 RepID=UPI002436297F|nr:barstar family protein [Pelosinus sp. IPA-1]GMA99523.1 hypothetical protein PIPA1_23230 [Pelosinus sp. IPA-1]